MNAKFGPSGNSDIFYEQGYKSSIQAPRWLKEEKQLDAYEYSCTKGVKISKERARELGQEAEKYGIQLSVHAPYYINLSSQEEENRRKSIDYIVQTLIVAKEMGAERIVVHAGSCAKMDRKVALETAKNTLKAALNEQKSLGLEGIHICPETMGKLNQLGDLDEVMELCRLDDFLLPTIDFGHIHARGLGCLNTFDDYKKIFDTMEKHLGSDRLKIFHSHYSRIEFTKSGEKKHWNYCNKEYGPEFEPIAELIYSKNLSPTIICESRGTMAEDAVELKKIYKSLGE